MNGREPRGFTIVELIVAITVSTIVLGAAYALLQSNQRFYRAQSQVTDVQQNIRAVAQLLPAELRELSAAGGDIEEMGSTELTVRVPRHLAFTCAATVPASGYVTLRNSLTYGYRDIDASRDYAYVYRDGDSARGSDDRWLDADISATAAATCADGSAATRLTLTNMAGTGGLTQLDSVRIGAPVRTYERVNYRLYEENGQYWLGTRSNVDGSWSSTSAVAGPLRPSNGVTFAYYDSTGAVTGTETLVAMIGITVRGRSTQAINVPGRTRNTQFEDSLSVRVALRNN